MLNVALDVQAWLLFLGRLGVTDCVLDALDERRDPMWVFPLFDSFLRLADRLFKVFVGGENDWRRGKQREPKTHESNCQSTSNHCHLSRLPESSANEGPQFYLTL